MPDGLNFDKTRVLRGREAAERFVELTTGSADTPMCLRPLFDDPDRKAAWGNLTGIVADLWDKLAILNSEGFGIYAVVNAGGHDGNAITDVRAVFADFDAGDFDNVKWHIRPHFVVWRSNAKFHAYWIVANFPLDKFSEVQRRIAAYYGSDATIFDLPRIMRVPGFLHQKDPANPCAVELRDYSDGLPGAEVVFDRAYSYDAVTAGLPGVPPMADTARDPNAHDPLFDLDKPENEEKARRLLRTREVAVEGKGGDAHTYLTACKLNYFGASWRTVPRTRCSTLYPVPARNRRRSRGMIAAPRRGMLSTSPKRLQTHTTTEGNVPGSKGSNTDALDEATRRAQIALKQDDGHPFGGSATDAPELTAKRRCTSDSRRARQRNSASASRRYGFIRTGCSAGPWGFSTAMRQCFKTFTALDVARCAAAGIP